MFLSSEARYNQWVRSHYRFLMRSAWALTGSHAMAGTAVGAIEHAYYERTRRGSFMEAPDLLTHLGLEPDHKVPGYPQLMRPCDIDGQLACHLTTFFEKGGIVTVFAFDQPVRLKESSGWWNDV